jgi:hypothetical protein
MTEKLNDRMEIGHVIEVHRDGTVTDANNLAAPTLLDDQLDSQLWTFFSTGYSGQDRYNGPIMHNSEYIGGRLEADILAKPGYYAAVESDYTHAADCETPDEDHEPNDTCDPENGDYYEGWAVVFRPSAETE